MSAAPSALPDLFNVKGLVAVVTGGGTGIGLMIATALESNGAIVYIASRRFDLLQQVVREHSRYGNLIPVQCDVSSTTSLKNLVNTVKGRHGYLNLLVNNAGVALNLLPPLPTPRAGDIRALQDALLRTGTRQDFAKSMDINCTAAYYCTVLFLELLDAGNRRGNVKGVTSQVITVASGGGFRRDDKVFSVSYTVSKTAAIHLGKMLANFLKDWQIRSNVIAPGIFPSGASGNLLRALPLLTSGLAEMTDGLISPEAVRAGVPLRREGTIDDMTGSIIFLASRAGSYINGSIHLVDGGRLTLFPSTY